MSEDERVDSRWGDLRRHPAVQVAAVYVGASWALIQVADIFFPSLDIVRGLGIVLAVGFFVIVGGAWWLAAREAPSEAGPEDTAPREVRARVRRSRRRFAYGAALTLLVVGGVFWWIRPSILGAVNPDAQVIAVLPFNTSGPGVELLGEGMVDLLSTNLDAVGGIRTADARTVLHRWRQRALEGSLDLEGSIAVGKDVDAGAVLLGSVVSVGPEVRLQAQLLSVAGRAELAAARAQGPADSVLALVDSLGLALLREIWLAREPVPNLRVSGITTGNLDAIRAYLRGQQFYRRSGWDSALVAFQEAVEVDSTFALAHYRLALAYGWSARHGGFGSPGARRHAELAVRYVDRLPPRERSLVRANSLLEEGDVAAHDTLLQYVARYPGDPEGWYMLGDVRYHAQPLLGLDREDLFAPFDRVLELDPSLAPAIIHPLELSLLFNDSAGYAGYLDALSAIVEPGDVERFKLAKLFWDQPDTLLARLHEIWEGSSLGAVAILASYRSERLTPNELMPALSDLFAGNVHAAGDRVEALQASALMLASLGRLEEAAVLFDTVWAIAPNKGAPYTSLLPVMAGIADTSFAARAIAGYENPPPIPGIEQVFLFSGTVYALSQGREAEARQLANRALAADTSLNRELYTALINSALGWADVLAGDTASGLEKMGRGLEETNYFANALFPSMPLRFARAAIQAAYPPTRAEGIRRLRYGFWYFDFLYMGISQLLLGQALEAAGDRAGAVQAYTQFIRLWENADPALQPRVETARRALQRLAAEGE